MRRAEYRLVLVDVGDNVRDLLLRVPQPAQSAGHRLVDDRHRSTAHQLFCLYKAKVRLDTGGVAVHKQAYSPSRSQHAALRVPDTARLRRVDRIVPVGANTLHCEFLTPHDSAVSTALSQASCAAESSSGGTRSSSILATSARC